MTTLNEYRIYCNTENSWVVGAGREPPTVCYNNNTHEVNPNSVQELPKVTDTTVKIQEESVATGGHFQTTTVDLVCTANTTSSQTLSWPFPVGALAVGFHSDSTNVGDVVNIIVGPDTITGYITADVSPATTWVSQNYTKGQTVAYTNGRTYTCTLDTTSSEIPTNTVYWTEGLELSVSQTVIDNTEVGFFIKLFNGVTTNDTKRVLSKDTVNNKIYVESNLTDTFLAASPTYIQQSVYFMYNFTIGAPGYREHGTSKVGAAHIPKDTTVLVTYTNKHPTDDKSLIGSVDYLY